MSQVSDFAQVRADGKTIPSSMSVKDMLALGWEPAKVTELKWHYNGDEIEISTPNGIHGIVVNGGNYIAALYGGEDVNLSNRLIILSPDGSIHGTIENCINDSGHSYRGAYRWFEEAMILSTDTFGVIFQTDEQTAFRCDVDARAASLISAVKVR